MVVGGSSETDPDMQGKGIEIGLQSFARCLQERLSSLPLIRARFFFQNIDGIQDFLWTYTVSFFMLFVNYLLSIVYKLYTRYTSDIWSDYLCDIFMNFFIDVEYF